MFYSAKLNLNSDVNQDTQMFIPNASMHHLQVRTNRIIKKEIKQIKGLISTYKKTSRISFTAICTCQMYSHYMPCDLSNKNIVYTNSIYN